MLYAVSRKRSNVAFRTHKLHTYAADGLINNLFLLLLFRKCNLHFHTKASHCGNPEPFSNVRIRSFNPLFEA